MTGMVALAAGLAAAAGTILAVLGARGIPVLPRPATPLDRQAVSGSVRWIGAALVGGVVVWALTGWPVLALATSLGVWWVGRVGVRRGRGEVDRGEAIAVWAELLRDNIAAAAGLEQALVATAAHVPGPLVVPMRRFLARLDRMPLLEALVELGDDIDHPSGDLVVVSLANAVRMEARDVSGLLSRLAEFIRADVRMRQRVQVSRARLRTSALIVIATTAVTGLFLLVFAPEMLEIYDTLAGQLWLIVVLGVFAVSGWLMHSLGQVEKPARFRTRRHALTTRRAGL